MPFTTPTPNPQRAVVIGAPVVHVSVAGSYTSTVAAGFQLAASMPPTAYSLPFTLPAARPTRAAGRGALVVHAPPAGSYISTVDTAPAPSWPPIVKSMSFAT